MRRKKLHNKIDSSGFTLIEVILALLILGLSLVTIIGLQTSVISQSIRDKNKTYALLAARSILTQLDLDAAGLEPAEKTDKLVEFLKNAGGVSESEAGFFEAIKDFEASTSITKFELPPLGNQAQQGASPAATPTGTGGAQTTPNQKVEFLIVNLKISWGITSIDSVEIKYLIYPQ